MNQKHFSKTVYADKDSLFEMKKKAQMFFLAKNRLMSEVGFGETVSPFKTKGLDFQEVRVYQPGDDIRLIDWKITAKHNKPYTKLYIDEKERQVFLIVDMRLAMKFATKGSFKAVLAAKCSALISFLAENKNDKIGFCVVGEEKIECALPQSGKETLLSLIDVLSEAGKIAETLKQDEISLHQALLQSEKFVKKGALVFILSDFSDFDDSSEIIIKRMARHSVCSLIHIYDKVEKNFPQGVFPISNGSEILFIDSKKDNFQKQYDLLFQSTVDKLYLLTKNEKIGYLGLETDSDYLNRLIMYCKGGIV